MGKLRMVFLLFLAVNLLTGQVFAAEGSLLSGNVATEYFSEDLITPLPESAEIPTNTQGLDVPAKSAVLMDQTTGTILFEKNPHEKLPPASITKVMTLLLVMEAIEDGRIALTDTVTVTEHAASMGGSQIWLEPNEEMSVDDLLKAACVASANDASTALGEYIAGSEDAFVVMMNEKAALLGMNDTTFKNCTGLDAEGHLTSAHDIAVMSRELIRHDKIKEYSTIWMDSLRDGKTELVNTNKLVRFYQGATGLKTGTTDGAGSCLSATATRGDLSLVAVVMGSPTSNERFAGARTLLDFGFASYALYTPDMSGITVTPVKVKKGVMKSVELDIPAPSPVLLEKGKEKEITVIPEQINETEAPVLSGQELGKIKVMQGEKVLAEYPLKTKTYVEKLTFWRAFSEMLSSMIKN